MIKILKVKCSRCGSKSSIPYIGFITQHGVKIYISKYPRSWFTVQINQQLSPTYFFCTLRSSIINNAKRS